MRQVYIYILMTVEDVPFYVGKTFNPSSRHKDHCRTYPDCKLIIIEAVATDDRWQDRERFWISYYGMYFTLLNRWPGGNGASEASEITRQKLSLSHKGLIKSDSHRQNLSLSGKRAWASGKKVKSSPEQYQKNHTYEHLRGRKLSTETRLKMSKSRTGLKRGPMPESVRHKIAKGVRLAWDKKKELKRFDNLKQIQELQPSAEESLPLNA